MKLNDQSGQMLLVVVLTMIVALTVGLSIVSRTITNLKISRQNEESQRAFQAAEAGIEQALQSSAGSSTLEFGNNAKYTTSITNPQGTEFLLNGGESVEQDVGLDIWLSDYPTYANPITGSVTIYWNTSEQQSCTVSSGEATKPALEIITISGSTVDPSVDKNIYDSCGRVTGSVSPGAGGTVSETTFNYAVNIPVATGLLMRVIPVYNSAKVGVTSSVSLPVQGTLVSSTGESGETVRKVQYFSSHPQVPLEIFPYSIISQ